MTHTPKMHKIKHPLHLLLLLSPGCLFIFFVYSQFFNMDVVSNLPPVVVWVAATLGTFLGLVEQKVFQLSFYKYQECINIFSKCSNSPNSFCYGRFLKSVCGFVFPSHGDNQVTRNAKSMWLESECTMCIYALKMIRNTLVRRKDKLNWTLPQTLGYVINKCWKESNKRNKFCSLGFIDPSSESGSCA